MTAVYQEIELQWDGETFTVTPTYRLIQQIEQQVSIAGMSSRIASGDPPMSHIAFVVAHLLRAAGAKGVSPEEVYAVMVRDMDAEQFAHFAAVVISGFIPQRDKPGNAPTARESASPAGGRKKKRR